MSSRCLVLAYHGCDVTTRDRLVRGQLRALRPSMNRYDWLGHGAYFFHGDYERALLFAQSAQADEDALLTARPIVAPTVVGVVLQIERMLDMTTQAGMQSYLHALTEVRRLAQLSGGVLPRNEAQTQDEDGRMRALDCAVINMIHHSRRQRGLPDYQAVQGAFAQGQRLSPGSGFRERSHVQIALRDTSCIRGWFIPPEANEQLLLDTELEEAEHVLAIAVQARTLRKPRVRAEVSRGAPSSPPADRGRTLRERTALYSASTSAFRRIDLSPSVLQ